MASEQVDSIDYFEDTSLDFPCANPVITWWQAARYSVFLLASLVFVMWDYKIALTVINFAICLFYFMVVGYKLLLVSLSLFKRPELSISKNITQALPRGELPIYTVLIPLYREANIANKIQASVSSLDYPLEKLDVKILLEKDDEETLAACKAVDLPECCELLVVPEGTPRTKPKACNYGLARATGQYTVIFDAEDRPEPDQLLKSVAAFRQVDENVACLQAKLNYYNPDQNWLTKFFALEYTAWFDLLLPGFHTLDMPIPLGGTSNHFRTAVLRALGGWDKYNVTEDCDLGIRLSQYGFRTLVLDSTTWEEANSNLWNWIRQRSRWVKGYIQTHLAHTRSHSETFKTLGTKKYLSFLLTVGGFSATTLLNPLYWLMLVFWAVYQWKLIYFDYTDASMQHFTMWSQVSWVFFGCAILLFAANFMFMLMNLFACARRKLWRLFPYALLSPVYWMLISLAGWKGFLQLIRKPFYWEKTNHGLDE